MDPAIEVVEDVLRPGGTGAAKQVGARGGERKSASLEQRASDRVSWNTDADGRQARRDLEGHGFAARQDQSERPGPEALREALGEWAELGDCAGASGIQDMHDERVVGGPTLRREDATDGQVVEGAGAEAVHGLGREGHQAALVQDGRSDVQTGLVGRQTEG
jgi:hypothetical protein